MDQKPLADLLIVKVNAIENYIKLPDWKKSFIGTVLAVGSSCRDVKEGDTVSFGAAIGMEAVFRGEEVRLLKEENIDFVYE